MSLKKVSSLVRHFSGTDPRFSPRRRMRSWEDFKQIPVSGREGLRDFVAAGFVQDAFNVTSTSGSTSSRMMIAHSRKAYESHLERLAAIYRQAGVKKGSLCLNLCSYALNSGGRLMDAAFKAAGAGVIPFGPVSDRDSVLEAAGLVRSLKPVMINAYTNQLFDLFACMGRKHSIRRCLVNGEPLWPDYRKRIEQMGGVQIHDHYGAMEISGLAVAVRPDDECMKVFAGGLLLEVLEDSGEASAAGSGDLLVTDLNNTCMPFIRYRLGDRVQLMRQKGSLWIKVLGRTQESILLNGVVVMKQELIRAVNDFLGHPRFFFVVDKHPLHYNDRLVINILGVLPRQEKALSQAVARAAGAGQGVDLRKHAGTIPRTLNGKIRYFIDARTKA